jgi:hypothetical protein
MKLGINIMPLKITETCSFQFLNISNTKKVLAECTYELGVTVGLLESWNLVWQYSFEKHSHL